MGGVYRRSDVLLHVEDVKHGRPNAVTQTWVASSWLRLIRHTVDPLPHNRRQTARRICAICSGMADLVKHALPIGRVLLCRIWSFRSNAVGIGSRKTERLGPARCTGACPKSEPYKKHTCRSPHWVTIQSADWRSTGKEEGLKVLGTDTDRSDTHDCPKCSTITWPIPIPRK